MILEAPSDTDLHAVVEEVWTTFLGPEEPLLPGDPSTPPGAGAWSAATTISGAWDGVVTVELPDAVALAVTGCMLGLAPGEEPAPEDVADAVGELVNMIGGNVKSLMAGPSALSLPLVARGTIAASSDLTQVCHLPLSWTGSPLTVRVLARHDHHEQHRESA